jgi:hypothetical protein
MARRIHQWGQPYEDEQISEQRRCRRAGQTMAEHGEACRVGEPEGRCNQPACHVCQRNVQDDVDQPIDDVIQGPVERIDIVVHSVTVQQRPEAHQQRALVVMPRYTGKCGEQYKGAQLARWRAPAAAPAVICSGLAFAFDSPDLLDGHRLSSCTKGSTLIHSVFWDPLLRLRTNEHLLAERLARRMQISANEKRRDRQARLQREWQKPWPAFNHSITMGVEEITDAPVAIYRVVRIIIKIFAICIVIIELYYVECPVLSQHPLELV